MARTRTPLAETFTGLLLAATVAVAATATTVLYEGSWEKVYAETEGTWKIVDDEAKISGRKLEISSDFKTQKATDLKVYFSPKMLSELNDDNATRDAKLIGDLKSEQGAQSYDIPSDIKLPDYKSIIINSATFSKLWCGSDLESPSES